MATHRCDNVVRSCFFLRTWNRTKVVAQDKRNPEGATAPRQTSFWLDRDVALCLDSLQNPQSFPLIYTSPDHKLVGMFAPTVVPGQRKDSDDA